jgi:hypothetical protein
MSKAHKPGGGIKSRNVVEKSVRTGRGAKAIVPAGAAQLGQRQGNHPTNKDATSYGGVEIYSAGRGYNKAQYGNERALRCSGDKAGPGCDRNIYKSGSMGTHGATNPGQPMKSSKPLWEGWEKK